MIDINQGIIIFYSEYCPYCIRAKSLLDTKKVQYQLISVDGQPEVRAEMAQLAGRRSVPQIWIHGQHVGGCDEIYALQHQDKLDALLAMDK